MPTRQRNWLTEELIEFFTILPSELEYVANKRGNFNKLGFICLYKFFQLVARFPNKKTKIPLSVVSYLGKQLNIDPDCLLKYDLSKRSVERHRAEIRELFGFKETSTQNANNLSEWLCDNVSCYDTKKVKIAALQQLRNLKLEPPTADRMERIIAWKELSHLR